MLDVWPDWIGREVVVLGSGASAASIAPYVDGRFPIIATNLSFRLVDSDCVLYAADAGFWLAYPDARMHPGLKLSASVRAQQYCPAVRLVDIHSEHRLTMCEGPVGVIGHGGNSGFQAVNLAVQFGARRVFLAGLDYCGTHWHDDHPAQLRNPDAERLNTWAATFDSQADLLRKWGVSVVNLSPNSALRNYRHEDCSTVLAGVSAL